MRYLMHRRRYRRGGGLGLPHCLQSGGIGPSLFALVMALAKVYRQLHSQLPTVILYKYLQVRHTCRDLWGPIVYSGGVRSFVLCGQGSSLLCTPELRPYNALDQSGGHNQKKFICGPFTYKLLSTPLIVGPAYSIFEEYPTF